MSYNQKRKRRSRNLLCIENSLSEVSESKQNIYQNLFDPFSDTPEINSSQQQDQRKPKTLVIQPGQEKQVPQVDNPYVNLSTCENNEILTPDVPHLPQEQQIEGNILVVDTRVQQLIEQNQTCEPELSTTAADKNFPKNIILAMQKFCSSDFTSVCRQQEPLKSFMNLKPKDCGKQVLATFLKTNKGNALGQMFFGNYRWGSKFLTANKVDVRTQIKCHNYWWKFILNNER